MELDDVDSHQQSQSQFIAIDVFDDRRVETSSENGDENTSTRTTESGNATLAVSGHTLVPRNDRHISSARDAVVERVT